MIAMIDNYDSFTYNLVQYLQMLGAEVRVVRNDAATVEEVLSWGPEGIVISPGPCTPAEAGISVELIQRLSGSVPILGVCLGHQAIGAAFGGSVIRARQLMHGKTSAISADGKGVYRGIRSPFQAMRYHSLVVSREGLPPCLEITAESEDGEIMGLRHREHLTFGVQFHPESVLTPAGKMLLGNFLRIAGGGRPAAAGAAGAEEAP